MKIENNLRDLNQIILLDSVVCPEKQSEEILIMASKHRTQVCGFL